MTPHHNAYDTLLARSGPQAQLLTAQPSPDARRSAPTATSSSTGSPRRGIYGYDDEHRPLIKITDGSTLLGVNPAGANLEAAVKAALRV